MIVWTEGFDQSAGSGSDTQLLGWALVSGSAANLDAAADRYTGDSQGFSARTTTSTVSIKRPWAVAEEHATAVFGLAVLPNDNASVVVGTSYRLATFYNTGGATGRVSVWLRATNVVGQDSYAIDVRAGTTVGGTLLATTGATAVVDNASWYYVEVKLVVHASAGSVTVRVNEIQVATASGLDTTGGVAGTTVGGIGVEVAAAGSATQWSVDDHYQLNGAGSAPQNDFLGDIRIVSLRPSAAGDATEWTPGGSGPNPLNWENVNGVGSLSGTVAWNAEGTDEGSDLYAMDALPASATGIVYGVNHKAGLWCSALNVGAALLFKDSTTVAEGAEQALGTTATAGQFGIVVNEAAPTKPSGGAWTTSAINAMQLGVRVKSIT